MLSQQLNKRVTIERKATGQDAFGQPLTGWEPVATVWASIEDMTGRQYFAAQAAQNQVQTKVTIRHRDGIEPAMRVIHGTTIYDIQAVLGTDRHTLALMVAKGLSNG